MKVRIDITNIIYEESTYSISYKLKITNIKTFEELYKFDAIIKLFEIERINITCNESILEQIIDKIFIFEKYLQGLLIKSSIKLLQCMDGIDETFGWIELNEQKNRNQT